LIRCSEQKHGANPVFCARGKCILRVTCPIEDLSVNGNLNLEEKGIDAVGEGRLRISKVQEESLEIKP